MVIVCLGVINIVAARVDNLPQIYTGSNYVDDYGGY
jgi:hypothetical protein